jgi:hypothetical protein
VNDCRVGPVAAAFGITPSEHPTVFVIAVGPVSDSRPEAHIVVESLPGLGPILGPSSYWSPWAICAPPWRAASGSPPTPLSCPPQGTPARGGNPRFLGEEGTRFSKGSFYQSGFASLRNAPESRAFFYDRKRQQGKKHTQALIALARRRVTVFCGRCCVMEPRSRAAL